MGKKGQGDDQHATAHAGEAGQGLEPGTWLTCGLLGGLTALFVVSGIDFAVQLSAILVTVVIAAVTGLFSGKVLAVLGRRITPYVDSEEFEGEEGGEEEGEEVAQACSATAESVA
jgi:hypothetical protein